MAAPGPRWQDLGARSLSAAVLIPAVLADVWVGGVWFGLLAAIVGVLMAHEWVTIVHHGDSVQFAFHAGAAMGAAFLPGQSGLGYCLMALAAIWGASVVVSVAARRSGWSLWGVPYVALPVLALVILRDGGVWGATAIVWLLCVVWAADTAAYFAGRLIGGPKLAPAVSPNKTWAGLGGAVAGAMAASVAVASYAGTASLAVPVAVAAALAIVEQGGDLFESALKRRFGVKDSGRLIPGHGGVLDRVDGLAAAAVAAAIFGAIAAGPRSAAAGLFEW